MTKSKQLKRRSFLVDEKVLQRLKQSLGVPSNSEVVQIALDRVIAMDLANAHSLDGGD